MRVQVEAPESASERICVIVGSILAGAGALRRSTTGGLGLLLLGGALVGRGLQIREANCRQAHGCVEPEIDSDHGVVVERSIVVQRPAAQVYAFWRNLENLPRFITHVKNVRELGEGKSSWEVRSESGARLVWDAQVVEDRPGEAIAWTTMPGTAVRHSGAVYFHPLPGDRTEVRFFLEFHPPLGTVGLKVAKWMGDDPAAPIDEDLSRFKRILESPLQVAAG